MRIERTQALALLIDVQERLYPVMDQPGALLKQCSTLLSGMEILGLPLLVTEQYPRGLGATLEPLRELLAGTESIEKMAFSCMDEPSFVRALDSRGRKQVIIAGIETHVCVLQTVLDLLQSGYQPVVVADACSSRKATDKSLALERMRGAGAIITSVESLLFELLRKAGTAEFKQISTLIK